MHERDLLAPIPAAPETYTIRLRNFVLPLSIGIHQHERQAEQRVRISIELEVARPPEGFDDDIERVPSYEGLVADLRALARLGHLNLIETLAECVLDIALADPAVRCAIVEAEKLDVFHEAESIGVRLERRRAV